MTTVLVLGSGRCGTSFTCHVLATRMGIDFGDVPKPTRATPHGSYEDRRFYQLNHHRRAGLIDRDEWTDGLEEIRRSRDGRGWGLKDPQSAPYTAELATLLEDALLVWCDRPPEACAISRSRYASNRPYAQWLEHFTTAREQVRAGLDGHAHLRLDFDRRWTENELEESLRAYSTMLAGAG